VSTRAKWPEIREIKSGARRGWENRARCRNLNSDAFESRDLEGGIPERARKAAERYCPVLRDCGLAADASKTIGLRGGEWRAIQDTKPRYVKTPLIPVETLLARRAS
jgi:hypothetical protein